MPHPNEDTPELRRWIVARIEAGQSPDELLSELIRQGMSEPTAVEMMTRTRAAACRLHTCWTRRVAVRARTRPGRAAACSARGGQRVASLVMYLNTPEAGGATSFPDATLEVAVMKGNAVFFSYDRPHSSTRSLHGGMPVRAGEKWVATKWLREQTHA